MLPVTNGPAAWVDLCIFPSFIIAFTNVLSFLF